MSNDVDTKSGRVEKILATFNESWMNYWTAYVDLQNQLYESVKAAREISWLAATDVEKVSEINKAQRQLFDAMPRRMDYMPLGQIIRSLDGASSKLDELEKALSMEAEKCIKLEKAILVLKDIVSKTKEGLGKSN